MTDRRDEHSGNAGDPGTPDHGPPSGGTPGFLPAGPGDETQDQPAGDPGRPGPLENADDAPTSTFAPGAAAPGLTGYDGGSGRATRRAAGSFGSAGGPGVGGVAPDDPIQIGPYTLLTLLGEGGFGRVYLAEQVHPVRRRVALKLIRPGRDTASVVARFEAERQALAVMDHPAVAKVLDGGTTPQGRPYFVMEYVAGAPITRHCDDARLSVEQRLELFATVCEAVQHAHNKGIVHRDLKPSNILVQEIDGRAMPKVIDFGIAKALDRELTERPEGFTLAGQVIGTPEYMAPEQAGAEPDIDARADIYALGAVLYELLTGQRPFEPGRLRSAAFAELQRIIREVDPPRPSTRLPNTKPSTRPSAKPGTRPGATPPDASTPAPTATDASSTLRTRTAARALRRKLRRDLDWVVMKCLEKDRRRRYDTAAALAEDLRRFLRHEPVVAGPPSAAYRAAKFVRRHRVAVATGSAMAATLAVAAAVSLNFAFSEAAARRDESAARARAETERAVAQAVNDFLNDDLLLAADPDRDGPGVTVAAVLDRAAATAAGRFADNPAVESRVAAVLGRAYTAIGLPDKAEPMLRRARTLLSAPAGVGSQAGAASGSAQRALWDVETLLVESLWRRGLHEEALEIARGVEAATAGLPSTDPERMDAVVQLANAQKYAGDLDAADALYRTGVALRRAGLGPTHELTLIAEYDLSLLTVARGERARAAGDAAGGEALIERGLVEMREAAARARGALGPTHSHTLACDSEVAAQLNRLNRFDEAVPLYGALIPAMDEGLGPRHWRTLQAVANFGRLLQKAGREAEARPRLERALAGFREWQGPASAGTLVITGWLAQSAEAVGDHDAARAALSAGYEAANAAARHAGAADMARALAAHARRTGDETAAAAWEGRAADAERAAAASAGTGG